MKRIQASVLCCLLLAGAAGAAFAAVPPEESFRQSFPHIRAESITPTAVPGVYEVVAGGRIAYYAPGPGYLIIGEMVTREGKNLTQERTGEIMAQRMKALPLERALKIGSGPHTVIEITDPDCNFCRRASDYLATRKDVTRYVFFFPLTQIHPNANAKVRYIFCATDRAKAYEEAMAGKLDDMKFTPCKSGAADELAQAHREIGERIGVNSTPLFFIDGQVVNGANIPLMEKILGAKK